MMSDSGVLFYSFNGFKVTGGYFAICLIATLIALFTIILNGIVIHTMLCHRRAKTLSDYFLSNMAISDLSSGIILMYVTSYSLLQYQILPECLFRYGQTHGVFISATLHRAAFTVDRFIKLIFPLHYFRILNKTAVIAISVLIWIISLTIGFLPLLGWRNEVQLDNGNLTCRYFGVLTNGYLALVQSLLTTSALLMVILYIMIFYVARKHAKSIAAQLGGFETSKSYLDKHSLKLAKTVWIVVGISNICWLPTCKYYRCSLWSFLLNFYIRIKLGEPFVQNSFIPTEKSQNKIFKLKSISTNLLILNFILIYIHSRKLVLLYILNFLLLHI